MVTRLQTQRQSKNANGIELYTSFADAIEKIYSSEGISGFYSGWEQDTIASVSSTFFYHLAYQFLREKRLRRAISKGEKNLGAVEELLVGALAGVFSRFFTTPMNNLVTRKQTSGQNSADGKVASSAKIVQDIYNEKGITGTILRGIGLILGFWSGYRSSILLTVNPSISYYLFELFKETFPPNYLSFTNSRTKSKTHSSLETFLFAAISKSIASTITYPFILAKARMQVSELRNLSPIRVLNKIIREEGWQVHSATFHS
jgi:hypothetical protein